MTKHDAACNLVEALEALRQARSELDRLMSYASEKIKSTGDALYPEIIEEMNNNKKEK